MSQARKALCYIPYISARHAASLFSALILAPSSSTEFDTMRRLGTIVCVFSRLGATRLHFLPMQVMKVSAAGYRHE